MAGPASPYGGTSTNIYRALLHDCDWTAVTRGDAARGRGV